MTGNERDDDAWFAAKRYGYGSGLPIAWQGWAILLGYVALIASAALLIRYSWIAYAGIVAAASLAFIAVCASSARSESRRRDVRLEFPQEASCGSR